MIVLVLLRFYYNSLLFKHSMTASVSALILTIRISFKLLLIRHLGHKTA